MFFVNETYELVQSGNNSDHLHRYYYGQTKNSCSEIDKLRTCIRYATPKLNTSMIFINRKDPTKYSLGNVELILGAMYQSSSCVKTLDCLNLRPIYFEEERKYNFDILASIYDCGHANDIRQLHGCMRNKLKVKE